MSITADSDMTEQNIAQTKLAEARDALARSDHGTARRLSEELIGELPNISDPARAEAELIFVESVIQRGHIYSAYDLFVMGDLYYLTPEVRAEILPHYRAYRGGTPGAKSIEQIIDGLGRSYDLDEVYGKMLDRQMRHELMTAAGTVKDLCRLIDKHYSPDKDYQSDAFNLFLYLVTCINREETQNLMVDNYNDIFVRITGTLRTCLLEREIDGTRYTMTGLMSKATEYVKALRFMQDVEYTMLDVDDSEITYFKNRMEELADRRFPPGSSASTKNERADFMNNRDLAVKMMQDIIRINGNGGNRLTEKNRAKVWDYHGDAME